MRRITLFSVLWALTLSGCFDDAVTVGLACENDLECGQGQACGPDAPMDPGPATPDQVCGVPQDEGWDACQSTDAPTCKDFETTLTCRNGFWTETNCDAACEEQVTGLLNDGACGAEDPMLDDCACAYLVDENPPNNPADCLQQDVEGESLELVLSAFESDDAAIYLQTCDEWCQGDSGLPFEGSRCRQTFLDGVDEDLQGEAPGLANAIELRLGDEPCVCRLPTAPACPEGAPPTECVNRNQGSGLLALCAGSQPSEIRCPLGCGTFELGMAEFDWCL